MEQLRQQQPTVVELRKREASKTVLNELWMLVGRPPQSEIVTTSHRLPAELERLKRATVSNLISGKHRPRPQTVESFIESCLHIARKRRKPIDAPQDSVEYWTDRHVRAVDAASVVPEVGSGEDTAVWAGLVGHEVWRAVDTDGGDALGEHATVVARRLLELQREVEPVLAVEDPWYDSEFVGRMSERMADLVSSLKDLSLSATEAALLVLAPYACQTDTVLRAARMIEVRPADLDTAPRAGEDRADYLGFLQPEPYRRLVTRASTVAVRSNRPSAAVEIGWWLYHRWIDSRRPPKSTFHTLLDDPVIGIDPTRRLLLETLERVLPVVRATPEQLRSLEHFGLDAGPGDFAMSARTLIVRERLVALLVKLAHALAIPLTTLPSVVVEHLGISDPVELDDLRNTVRRSSWSGMALTVSCHHPAVLVALQEHATQVEAVVRSTCVVANDSTTLSSLRALSTVTATADKVVPARNSADQLLFTTPVDRFRLDEERVRELLMGENLYRDPALAIRELYQNALDACRLRQARQLCSGRKDGTNLTWPARITFFQGVDEATGRHYLECEDNGVGMEAADLRGAFSHAGVRFVDRPEYVYDATEFRKYEVDFVPNSRFGIGVISYFMLADEIEVETCRMAYGDQRKGPVVTVAISGPGHLFRIKEDHTAEREPGTRVRLYLKNGDRAPSCVDLLRKVVGIAEFRTVATHDGESEVWKPNVLHPRRRPAFEQDGIDASGHTVQCPAGNGGQVIWCEHGGALLVDGIYVRTGKHHGGLGRPGQEGDLRGAVVNLTGQPRPRLSVDRSLVLNDVSHHVRKLLTGAVSGLVEGPPAFLRIEWIRDVAQSSPWVADLVTTMAASAGTSLPLGNDEQFDFAATGCFPPDLHFLRPGRDDTQDWAHRGRQAHQATFHDSLPNLNTDRFPDHIALWRWLAHHPMEAIDQLADIAPDLSFPIDVLPALPSDAMLLANNAGWSQNDELGPDAPPPPGHLLWVAAATGASPREAAERAVLLGMRDVVPDRFSGDVHLDDVELALLSENLDGEAPWLTTDTPVPITHFLEARVRLRIGVEEAAGRLSGYGFSIPSPDRLAYLSCLSGDQIKLLSHRLDGEGPWIWHGRPVAYAHLIKSSLELGHDIAEAADQLRRLGFRVAIPLDLPQQPTEHDLPLISVNLDGVGPWLEYDEPVPPRHVIKAAQAFGGLRKVTERLVALGFLVMGSDRIPDQLGDVDQEIAHEDDTGRGETLEVTKPVQATDLLLITTHVPGGRIRDVADRLRSYGFEVHDDVVRIAEQLTRADLVLLSRDLDGEPSWLDITKPVPIAHLACASLEANERPQDVSQQLEAWGFRVTVPSDLPTRLGPEDRQLVHDRWRNMWLNFDLTVPLSELIMAARRTQKPLIEVTRRLRQLGFIVPDMGDVVHRAFARVPRC